MNPYLKNLNKIEFVITYACTGRCKHCSEGEHSSYIEHIDPEAAADAVLRVSELYGIKTVMAFGGEPLLYPDSVFAIMRAAFKASIPHRQVITNGFFTKDKYLVSETASRLFECGVNDLLVSADAFHQESIPLDAVRYFVEEAKRCGIPTRLQPAWLVSRSDRNSYNLKTREILESFSDMDIAIGEGNVVFPEGNALKYLSEYFTDFCPKNPYAEDPCDVKCLSFSPSGDVLDGNAYRSDVMDIIKNYAPKGAGA